MDAETAKAINTVSKKVNEIDSKLDHYINLLTDALKLELTDTQLGLYESYEQALENADELTNIEIALCEVFESLEV